MQLYKQTNLIGTFVCIVPIESLCYLKGHPVIDYNRVSAMPFK